MLIYANFCKYHRQTDGQTGKHIKSIVWNLTISKLWKKNNHDFMTCI